MINISYQNAIKYRKKYELLTKNENIASPTDTEFQMVEVVSSSSRNTEKQFTLENATDDVINTFLVIFDDIINDIHENLSDVLLRFNRTLKNRCHNLHSLTSSFASASKDMSHH